MCAGSHYKWTPSPGTGWAELLRPGLGAVGHSLGLSIRGMRAQFLRTLALNRRTQAGTPSAQEAGGLTPTLMAPEPAEHSSEKRGMHSSTSYRYGSPKPLWGPHPFLSPVTAAFPALFSDFCPLWRRLWNVLVECSPGRLGVSSSQPQFSREGQKGQDQEGHMLSSGTRHSGTRTETQQRPAS